MSFPIDMALARLERRLASNARHSPLPGQDADDTYAEMLYVLVKACDSYAHDHRSGTPFDAWFWTCWNRYKADWMRRHFAARRGSGKITTVPLEDEEQHPSCPSSEDEYLAALVPPYVGTDPTEQGAYEMLANGAGAVEVIVNLGLSRRRYYGILTLWKERIGSPGKEARTTRH